VVSPRDAGTNRLPTPQLRAAAGIGWYLQAERSGNYTLSGRLAITDRGGLVPTSHSVPVGDGVRAASPPPRLTNSSRSRRDTPLDITAESGLSAGSIYAHYRNKAELVQASAREALSERAAVIGEWAASDTPPDPDELLSRLVAGKDPAAARVAVQTWGEATTDPAVRAIVVDMIDQTRAMLHDCVTAWLIRVEGHEPAEAGKRAASIAGRVSALYLAALLNAALQPPDDSPGSAGTPLFP
jgi:AcrR family transcriptional regulator